MAKLSAHGTEIGTLYLLTSARRYMSDGTVLRNGGFGWKLHARLRAGVVPEEAFARQVERAREFGVAHPEAEAYRKALHSLAGLSKRWKLHAAVELMPEDPDGVWSEVCDGYGDNVSADLDDIVELCRLYRTALGATRRAAA